MNNSGPEDSHFRELMARVESGHIKEVVLATSTSVEGEATANFIADRRTQWERKVAFSIHHHVHSILFTTQLYKLKLFGKYAMM